jgi:hypothetical protein
VDLNASGEQIEEYLLMVKKRNTTASESFFKHTVYGLRFLFRCEGRDGHAAVDTAVAEDQRHDERENRRRAVPHAGIRGRAGDRDGGDVVLARRTRVTITEEEDGAACSCGGGEYNRMILSIDDAIASGKPIARKSVRKAAIVSSARVEGRAVQARSLRL